MDAADEGSAAQGPRAQPPLPGARPNAAAWFAIVAVLSLAIVATAIEYRFTGTPADETGMALVGKRTAAGEVPYRDFFTLLPPAMPVLAALPAVVWQPGIVPLRVMTGIVVVLATLSILALGIRRGAAPGWAAIGALWLPAHLFTFWPVATHHWLAIGLALIGFALLLTRSGTVAMIAAGLTLGTGALCNQLVAFVTIVLLAALLRTGGPIRDRRLVLSAFVAPALAALVWLGSHGAVDDAVRNVLLWPLLQYKQPGGYNSAEVAWLVSVPGTVLSDAFPLADELIGSSLVLLLAASVMLVIASARRGMGAGRKLDVLLLGSGAIVFLAGRQDMQHLALWTPIALIVAVPMTREAARPWLRTGARLVLILGLGLSVARFLVRWTEHPPDIDRVLATDREMSSFIRSSIIGEMPRALRDSLFVMVLSPASSAVYLYWSPGPLPGFDWILPPSGRQAGESEYARLRAYIDRYRPPYLIIPEAFLEEFTAVQTPLREPLRDRYEPFGTTQYGLAMRRRAP